MNNTAGNNRRCDDRGSYTLEAALCLAVLFPVLGWIAAYGLAGLGDGTASNAAAAAARAASIAADPDSAQSAGQQAASASLAQAQRTCRSSSISIDTSNFPAQAGDAGAVSVTVTCTVSMADLAIPGLPVSKTLRATRHSAVDRYVTRGGN
ncbi:hypothetical protein AB0M87_31500 [Streptomyces sp. NPDC051320]|uniref:hypothetical protein n=1 Tax=Streptomyces sp. NPDC051320 TaxID=3154644 RepID=UPI003430701E